MDLEAYLGSLASYAPTPGGGSAATIVGALGAALVAMVARITAGNPAYAAVREDAERLIAEADSLRTALARAREVDEAAYAAVVATMALPRTTPEERTARTGRLQAALERAATAPLHAASLGLTVVTLARRAGALGNKHLASDVSCALIFGRAAVAASAENVRINHAFLKDAEVVATQERALRLLEAAVEDLSAEPSGVQDAAG